MINMIPLAVMVVLAVISVVLVLALRRSGTFRIERSVTITLEPQAGATVLTQAMHGPSPFISQITGLLFNTDKVVGNRYEEGLGTLKTLVEQKG